MCVCVCVCVSICTVPSGLVSKRERGLCVGREETEGGREGGSDRVFNNVCVIERG